MSFHLPESNCTSEKSFSHKNVLDFNLMEPYLHFNQSDVREQLCRNDCRNLVGKQKLKQLGKQTGYSLFNNAKQTESSITIHFNKLRMNNPLKLYGWFLSIYHLSDNW